MNTVADIAMNREWNGRKIRIRPEDRYVCLTDMAVSVKKKLNNWTQLDSTNETVEALSEETGIPASELLVIKHGCPTWGHPQLALDCAQWCSVKLKIQCLKWLDELLTTGMVKLTKDPAEKVFILGDLFYREPSTWERMFTAEYISLAEKLTGWSWNWSCMGQFINSTVYDYMPSEAKEALKELNPRTGERGRIAKHHQFLKPEVKQKVIDHVENVLILMRASGGNLDLFELQMANVFGAYKSVKDNPDQLELFTAQTVFILKPTA